MGLDAGSLGAVGAISSGQNIQTGDYGRAIGGTGSLAAGTEQLIGAYGQARAIRQSGRFQRVIAEQNAQLSNLASEQALKVGQQQAAVTGIRVGQLIGHQRAAFGNQGVDVNSGSAADVQVNTAQLGAIDQQTIRNNAMRQALGLKIQAVNEQYKGIFASLAAKNQADATVLTGGAKFAQGLTRGADLNWEGRIAAPNYDKTAGAGGWDTGDQT